MTRRTKDPRLAMLRLAAALGIQVEQVGRSYRLDYGFPSEHWRWRTRTPRTAKRCVAFLIEIAIARDMEPSEIMRLTEIQSYGLKFHEHDLISRHLWNPGRKGAR